MTQPIITNLPKSQVEIKFVVSPEEAKPYLDQAVIDISTERPLQGFRPGKAGYEDVKRAYGEMTIWQHALERVVRASYVKAVLEHRIETVGSPEIAVDTLVPNQAMAFTVTASVMPSVTTLVDYSAPLVEWKQKEITPKQLEDALADLQKMRRTEVAVDRPARKEDLAVIDLEITKDGVIVEGGTSHGFRVYLNEAQFIPGFAEQIVGLKKNDVKQVELPFPDDHFNKQLAGKPAQFSITVKDVFELQSPELNDEFAKALGVESLEKLKELLTKNLQQESDQRTREAAEIELLETLVKGSKFSDVPDLLVNEEVRRMMHELEHTAEERGMKMSDYLASIKKTRDQLTLDFIPRALERIHTAVLIKEVSKRENVTVTDEEVAAEQDRILDGIKESDTETRARVASPDYQEYLGVQMKNRKVLELLKQKGIKGYQKETA